MTGPLVIRSLDGRKPEPRGETALDLLKRRNAAREITREPFEQTSGISSPNVRSMSLATLSSRGSVPAVCYSSSRAAEVRLIWGYSQRE